MPVVFCTHCTAGRLTEWRFEPLPPNARFDIGGQQYPRMYRVSKIAIRMSDGAVLSADLTLPGYLTGSVTEPLPVVLNFTPYNKMLQRFSGGSRMRALAKWIGASDRKHFTDRDLLHAPAGGGLTASVVSPTLVSRGYAYLMVDVRRTGTSTGKWECFGESEQQDYLEVLRWICEQPWCNGNLAATLSADYSPPVYRRSSRARAARTRCARWDLPVVSRRRTSPSGSAPRMSSNGSLRSAAWAGWGPPDQFAVSP